MWCRQFDSDPWHTIFSMRTIPISGFFKNGFSFSPRERVLFLLLVAALVITFRLHTYDEPIEADEAIMAVIANDWMDGGRPYITAWENKPLGSFIIYAAGLRAFGNSEYGIRSLSLMATLVSTLLLFLFLKRYAGSLFVWSLLIWTPLAVWPEAHANGANAEIFLIPLLLLGTFFIDRYLDSNSAGDYVAATFFFSASLLIKQVTFPFLFVPVLFLRQPPLKKVIALVATFGGTWLLYVAVYSFCGYGLATVNDQFLNNLIYASHGQQNSAAFVFKQLLLIPFDKSIAWLTPFFLLGCFFCIRQMQRNDRRSALLLTCVVCSMLSIATPGWQRPHYFLLLIPFLPLVLANIDTRQYPRYAHAINIVCLVLLFSRIYVTYLSQDPRMISKKKYDALNKNWFLRDRYIGREALRKGYTGAPVFVANNHPGILFYSHNKIVTRCFVDWMHALPGTPPLTETWRDVRERAPRFIFVPEAAVIPKTINDWITTSYFEKDHIDGCLVLMRKP